MQKATSLLLCILMLASNANVTYAKHFCGGQEILSVITIGETFLSCSDNEDSNKCNDEKQKSNPCCKNKYENVDIDDNYANVSNDALINVSFIKSFVSVFVFQLAKEDQQPLPIYADYESPPENKDMLVLYQVFTI